MTDDHPKDPESPPFLSTWPRVYSAVLGSLAVLIVLFYIFMKAFT